MSPAKKDSYLSAKLTDQTIAKKVSEALHHEHADVTAAIKQIERITGIKAVTASKWYNGIYAPKSRHLLIMAAHYPQVLQAVCELIGISSIWQQAVHTGLVKEMRADLDNQWGKWKKSSSIGDRFVTIQVKVDLQNATLLNQRQLWFIGQLQQGYKMHADDLINTWNVHSRTAKRDLAGLLEAKLIVAIKMGRSCKYELM